MKLGVLFSGGKDSAYALYKAMQSDEVVCLITIASKNDESYMFHTPNISMTRLQAEAIGLPNLVFETEGVKEEELADLEKAIEQAVKEYGVEGIVTGAIESVYQACRVQRICIKLGLWCFNPLWKKDQAELLNELISEGFTVLVSGVFAYPMGEEWLGAVLDVGKTAELVKMRDKYGISPSGEGGELESTVLDAPYFRKKIRVVKARKKYSNYSGNYIIDEAVLAEK